MFFKKKTTVGHLVLYSLAQAVVVGLYCWGISALMTALSDSGFEPTSVAMSLMMLLLIVFSVALVGAVVFGYPAYLLIQKEVKQAILNFVFTFVWAVIIFVVLFLILFI